MIDVSPTLIRNQTKIAKEFKELTAIELINYAEIVKNMCLSKLEHLKNIEAVYKEL